MNIGFDCTDEENGHALAILRKRAWLALRAKIDEQTADNVILGKLRAYFEERFRYDEHGVPRVWRPDDDIDGAFKKAKDQTLELITLYARIRPHDPTLTYELPSDALESSADESHSPEDFDFESTLIVLPETKVLDISSRFKKDADAYYVEAKRSMVSSVGGESTAIDPIKPKAECQPLNSDRVSLFSKAVEVMENTQKNMDSLNAIVQEMGQKEMTYQRDLEALEKQLHSKDEIIKKLQEKNALLVVTAALLAIPISYLLFQKFDAEEFRVRNRLFLIEGSAEYIISCIIARLEDYRSTIEQLHNRLSQKA